MQQNIHKDHGPTKITIFHKDKMNIRGIYTE